MSSTADEPFLQWDHDKSYLYAANHPVCFHCHHYNMFIQETVDEALGATLGTHLREEASADAWRPIIEAFLNTLEGGEDASEKLAASFSLFASVGHGKLIVEDASLENGSVYGETLHYSTAWQVIHDGTPAPFPVDGMAAGFISAAFELVYELEPGSIEVKQTSCVSMGDARSQFEISRRDAPRALHASLTRAQVERYAEAAVDSLEEDEIDRLSQTFSEMLAQITSDARGLVEGFGILVTLTPTSYYNILCTRTIEHLKAEHPTLLKVSEQMFYEAGRLCGFNTFGGVIKSPEWEALIGRERSDEPLETLLHTCAIARSFGFGKWSVQEYYPEDLLILRSPATYEEPYVLEFGDRQPRPACYLFTGASEAMVRLAENVDWAAHPSFGLAYYDATVKQPAVPWTASQTQCRARGDDYAEVTVEQ